MTAIHGVEPKLEYLKKVSQERSGGLIASNFEKELKKAPLLGSYPDG